MTTPRTELGERGEAVRAWQAYLVRHGHPGLACDGIHGADTEAASQAWDAQQRAAEASQATAAEGDVRGRIVALATSYVGLACTSPDNRERYLDLLAGPNDTDSAIRQFLLSASGCALVCRGLLRKVGYKHHRLESRARVGMAPSDMQEMAREVGAWRTGGQVLPRPGDMVLINRDAGGHFYTCTSVETGPPGLCRIESVDGGVTVPVARGKAQAIAARRRTWTLGAGGRIVDTRDGGGSYAVLGWADCSELRW